MQGAGAWNIYESLYSDTYRQRSEVWLFFFFKLQKGDWVKALYNISERDGMSLIYRQIPRINHGKDVVFKHVFIHIRVCIVFWNITVVLWPELWGSVNWNSYSTL